MTPRRFLIMVMSVICLFSASAVSAASCPADLLLALSRADGVCGQSVRDTLCYGSGAVTVTPSLPNIRLKFAQPGDQVDPVYVESLQLGGASPTYSVAWLRVQANLAGVEQRAATLILLGEVEMHNGIPPTPTLNVSARANVNLRQTPQANGTILARAAFGAVLVANGRTKDSDWLRVLIPNQDATGWVSAQTLNSGDFGALIVVDPSETPRHPFETFSFKSGVDDAPCAGTPQSGLLLQTPNLDNEVQLTINGALLRLTGTAFLQADQSNFVTNVVEGLARIESAGASQLIPAGAQARIPLGADGTAIAAPELPQPDESDLLPAAVVALLDRQIVVAEPLTQAQIDTAVGAAEATPGPTPEVTPAADTCQRAVINDRNVRRGPGEDYPVVGAIHAGDALDPVAQTTLPDGSVWWKLYGSRWLLADSIREVGPCQPPPETPFVRLPGRNTLRLETCQTSNGPIRPGQTVTITFTPDAWRTIAEAEAAVNHRWGRLQVGDSYISVYPSDPVQVGEYRYLVTFSGQWTAQPGTYRVAGSHLSYRLICTITVMTGG